MTRSRVAGSDGRSGYYAFQVIGAGARRDRLIVCAHEVGLVTGHRIDIGVGSELHYARVSTSQIIVQDAKGKEHKLTIESETMKTSRQ